MPDTLDPDRVQRHLQLTDEAMARLVSLRQPVEPQPPLRLPDRADADALLLRLGVDPMDRADVLAARPDPDAHPELWWVLDRVYHDINSAMGKPVPIEGFAGYPALPGSTGSIGRHLPVWLYLALASAVSTYHTQRGIPEAISWGSLGEALAGSLRAHREATSTGGLGGFGWTLPLRFRGVDYRLGRLAFNLGEMSLGNGPCGYVLSVHIPAGGRLDIDDCIASMQRARSFFARHHADRPIACFACESWLMDPQLGEYLDARSNILRFQALFAVLPLVVEQGVTSRGNTDMLDYVFGDAADTSADALEQLDRLPQDSSLQRAFVSHLRAGRHWHVRTGWRPAE